MKAKIILLLTLLFHAYAAQGQMVGTLENDARIVRGTLPNGLSYYLINNPAIAGYADFTFIQKTGLAMEDSTNRGMTYLMECMALTETSNFPDGAIFSFVDDMGLESADGLVIEAGDYYTTYTFSNVPVHKNESMVDSMLLAMYNISSAIIVDDRSVERGKNFFKNIFSSRNTLEQRVKDSLYRYYFRGTPLAPLTFKDLCPIIESYDAGDVRNFFRTRCRPDIQAIVISGDIDTLAVKSKIRSLFQVVSRPEGPRPDFPDTRPGASGGGYFYFKDKEADCATVTFDYLMDPVDRSLRHTAVPFIYNYLSSISVDILGHRLEQALETSPVHIISADVEIVPFLNRNSLRFKVKCAPKDYVEGYEFILGEINGILQSGISDAEYRRSMKNLFFRMDGIYDRRSSLDNKYYTRLCVSNFTDGYVMAGIELFKEYVTIAGPSMDSSTVYRFLSSIITQDNTPIVVCTSPEHSAGLEYFTAAPRPFSLDTLVISTVSEFENNSKLISRKKFVNPSTGVVSRRLSNGSTIAYRQMTGEPGWVHFEAVARGGLSLAGKEAAPMRDYINDVARMSVMGGMNVYAADRLKDALNIELERDISVDTRKITGKFHINSMDSFMQLVSMCFQGLEQDTATFGKYLRMMEDCAPYSSNSPEKLFKTLHLRDVRSGYGDSLTDARLPAIDYLAALEFVNSLYSNPGEFSFIFLGDFDEGELLSSFYRHIASLPGHLSRSPQSARGAFFIASYDDVEEIRIPMESPRWLHSCKLTFPSSLNIEDRLLTEMTAKAIERSVIRKLSLLGILANAERRFYSYPEEVVTIDFHFNTAERQPDMEGIFAEILMDLAMQGVSSNEVAGIKRNLDLKEELRIKTDYEYWKGLLRRRYIERKDFYTHRRATMDSITEVQVNEALLQVLDKGRISVLSVGPEQ